MCTVYCSRTNCMYFTHALCEAFGWILWTLFVLHSSTLFASQMRVATSLNPNMIRITRLLPTTRGYILYDVCTWFLQHAGEDLNPGFLGKSMSGGPCELATVEILWRVFSYRSECSSRNQKKKNPVKMSIDKTPKNELLETLNGAHRRLWLTLMTVYPLQG